MKIELEIPDWADSTRVLIIAGTECVAQKLPHENFWMVKTTRCNRCGECCLDGPPTPYGLDDESKCLKLKLIDGQWTCMAGMGKSLRCVLDPNLVGYQPCCIEHKKVKA